MGNVTKSKSNNITSPNGNSLAVFVDGETGVMKVKDVRGNVQDLADYINTANNSGYLYAYSKDTQVITTDTSKISFGTLELNKNINLIDNNTISFNQEGVYNFNLSIQAVGDSPSELYVFMLNGEDLINWSKKWFICEEKTNSLIYNITLNVSANESFSFGISSNILTNELGMKDDTPSATLTISKIG